MSFENNIRFYKKLPNIYFSVLFVSTAYIIWDIFATQRGDWAFNPQHLLGVYIFGLPVEEILFFITVPYSSIFIYETVRFYFKDQQLGINKLLFVIPCIVSITAAFIFYSHNYTFTVFAFTAAFFICAILFYPSLLNSKNFWLTLLISFIPFFIVNYFLTSIPIVTYNDFAFSGKRFITIPYEDFIYSFSMISLWILFYELSFKILSRKKT